MPKGKLHSPIESLVEKFKPQSDEIIKAGVAMQTLKKKFRLENPQSKDLEKLTKLQNQIVSNPEKLLDNRVQRIQALFDQTQQNCKKQNGIEIYKRWAVSKYVIKSSQIPQAIYKLDQQIALDQGHGRIEITKDYIKQKNGEIIDGQTKSLQSWIDYLTGPDAFYEDWYKYLVARSLPKMGKLDKAKWQYEKRSESSVSAFPELDSEALGIVQAIVKHTSSDKDSTLDQAFQLPELIKLGKTADFEKLYPQVQKKLMENKSQSIKNKKNIKGSWTKYDQGSDHKLLEKGLESKGTGWCTASGAAKGQLKSGDFYVFYSQDKDQNNTLPRIAIRMLNGKINEIRGVLPNQELEPELTEIMDKKATTLDGYENYQKATLDMKQMTQITKLQEQNQDLSSQQLRFLYEIDAEIQGFGYQKDPRITQVKSIRNESKDLQDIFGCKRDQLILDFYDTNEDLENEIVYVHPAWKENLASSKTTSAKILEKLAQDPSDKIRALVAKKISTPQKSLELLSKDSSADVRKNIALNKKSSPEILAKLSQDSDKKVLFEVGSNFNTPLNIIQEFAISQDTNLRKSISLNINSPLEILAKLSQDSDAGVRNCIAQNPNTPIAILEKLSQDADQYVREGLIDNPSLSSKIMENLASDDSTPLKMNLANRKDLSNQILEKLAVDKYYYVRQFVAKNPGSSQDLLFRLSSDASEEVRENVAKNPNSSIGTLLKLSTDKDPDVRLQSQKTIENFKKTFSGNQRNINLKTKSYNLKVNL